MLKEIYENFSPVSVELLEGDKGVFDIDVFDDPPALIFSKNSVGRFPTSGEITKILLERGA